MPKTIAIDIRDAYGKKTGKGWYTYHIIRALLRKDRTNKYIFFTKKDKPPFNLPPNATIQTIKSPSLLWHFSVIRKLKKLKVDTFWAPTSYIIPAYAPKSIRIIVTIHDLVALLFPEHHNKKAILIESKTLKKAIEKSAHIFTVSRNTAHDLTKMFAVPMHKISITHCAASSEFKPIPLKIAQNILEKFNLPADFILAVGTLEPRKNLVRLIKAFSSLSSKHPLTHLIIAGDQGWKYKKIFKEASQNNRIRFLGYVEQSELVALYSLARIFVFPSLYEGFGMPPLEAMRCGCPVITSSTSSIPEVVGKSAITINPIDESEITMAMDRLLSKPELRAKLSRESLNHSQLFDWDHAAEIVFQAVK